MHRYYYRDEAVSGKDCDEFIEKYKDAEFSKGLVGATDLEYRKAKVHWLENNNLLALIIVRPLIIFLLGHLHNLNLYAIRNNIHHHILLVELFDIRLYLIANSFD